MEPGTRAAVAVEVRPGPPFASILMIDDWRSVRTRVAVSPMHTLLAGLFEIVAGRARGVPSAWVQTVLGRARELDLSPFAPFAVPNIRIPDYLVPIPESAGTFAEQLEKLASTPAATICADLEYEYGDDVPQAFARWSRQPDAALATYCRAVEAWWNAVLKPTWPAIRSALESEVLRVARLLATLTPEQAFPQVHHRLIVAADSLWIQGGPMFERHVLGNRTLLLAPFAAGADAALGGFDHREGPVYAYAAPGTQHLLAGDTAAATDDLEALLGTARARILVQLHVRATTTELAATLGYAASTVSTHLHALSLMGLVHSTRHGKFVFYERTERAHGLVELYSV